MSQGRRTRNGNGQQPSPPADTTVAGYLCDVIVQTLPMTASGEPMELPVARVRHDRAEAVAMQIARDGAHCVLSNARVFVPAHRLAAVTIIDPRPYPADVALLTDLRRTVAKSDYVAADRLRALEDVIGRLIEAARAETAEKPETEWGMLANVMVAHWKPWIIREEAAAEPAAAETDVTEGVSDAPR
jgi:hypothetical protein